ncbi:hypothetical protein ACPESR_06090 [Nocardia testacea]|uniref:hypothetical protein n=1 Tax=Nocardia testacea TaxID=248551 RepID=UPI003C2AF620
MTGSTGSGPITGRDTAASPALTPAEAVMIGSNGVDTKRPAPIAAASPAAAAMPTARP